MTKLTKTTYDLLMEMIESKKDRALDGEDGEWYGQLCQAEEELKAIGYTD